MWCKCMHMNMYVYYWCIIYVCVHAYILVFFFYIWQMNEFRLVKNTFFVFMWLIFLCRKQKDNNRSQLPGGAIWGVIWVIEQFTLWQYFSILILLDPYPHSGGLHASGSWKCLWRSPNIELYFIQVGWLSVIELYPCKPYNSHVYSILNKQFWVLMPDCSTRKPGGYPQRSLVHWGVNDMADIL